MPKTKNVFMVHGDVITIVISRGEQKSIASATIREDYLAEIQSTTWYLKEGRYPHSTKFGALHHFVMKKWYGDAICEEMKENRFVIDHMDNNSLNSEINNLCFLSLNENIAKGHTVDIKSREKERIALSMTKDFATSLFQISICFNHPPKLEYPLQECPAVVEIAHLLYDCDYPSVISDANSILLDYENRGVFRPHLLHNIDYHIEGAKGHPISTQEYYERMFSGTRPVFFMNKLAPIDNWTPETPQKYLSISNYSF